MIHQRLHVLVVDNNQFEAKRICDMLRSSDRVAFHADYVLTCIEAVDRVMKADVHVILLGLNLPDKAGLAAFRSVADANPDIPIVILASLRDCATARTAMEQGAQDYIIHQELTRALLERTLSYAAERHRVSRSLQAGNATYQELFDDRFTIIYTHDLEGNLTSMNSAGEQLLGYRRGELISKNIRDILPPESIELARNHMNRKAEGESQQTGYELEVLKQNGDRIPMEVSTRVILEDGRPIGVQGFARDISKRKNLEAKLESARKYEAIGQLASTCAEDIEKIFNDSASLAESLSKSLGVDHPLARSVDKLRSDAKWGEFAMGRLLALGRRKGVLPISVKVEPPKARFKLNVETDSGHGPFSLRKELASSQLELAGS